MGRRGKFLALAACFAAGIVAAGLLAVGGRAADTTTADTTTAITTTAPADTTQEATTVTVATTTTVESATTQETVPTTTAAESSDDGTPVWVWVLLAILAIALTAAIVLLARRGNHSPLSPEERGKRLDHAVGTWAAQGWAVETQTLDSAVLQRAGERMIVAVDASVRSRHGPARTILESPRVEGGVVESQVGATPNSSSDIL